MMTDRLIIDPMIEELIRVNCLNWTVPQDQPSKIEMLHALMTVSRPAELSESYYELEEVYLTEQKKKKQQIKMDTIHEQLADKIYIYKGDITAIEADAIVNAANEKLLGCFVPGHKCIDNAIGMAAGLGLRNECNRLMEDQGYDEPAGQAKVTKGYNLPSRYVVHTVGPNVNGPYNLSDAEVEEQLKSCYVSILKEVNQYEDIRNVVFCSISTGIYGVAIKKASEIALMTISEYLSQEKHHLDKVVIDVFSESDDQVYKRTAKRLFKALS